MRGLSEYTKTRDRKRQTSRKEDEMQRRAVTSSNISEIGYDEGRRILEVLFHNGNLYQYFDVPPQVYQELMGAGSVGQYLNINIKGRFRYSRV